MLTDKQFRIIRMGIQIGRTLQREHPEIAEEYCSTTIPQIIETHSIATNYSVKPEIAQLAVRYALHGHRGGYDILPYEGLLDKETLERLCYDHKHASGIASLRDKKGLFGRTPEKVHADNVAVGRALAAQGKGMFKLTHKERRALGYANHHHLKNYLDNRTQEQRAADISRIIEAQGKVRWVEAADENPSELEYALTLAALPENHKGRQLNTRRIAQQLNERYHEGRQVRTSNSVCSYLSLWRKENGGEPT